MKKHQKKKEIEKNTHELISMLINNIEEVKILNFISNNKIDVSYRDGFFNTPFILSANRGYKKLIKELLILKSDVNATNIHQNCALKSIVCDSDLESVELLISNGADIDLLTIDNQRYLECFLQKRDIKLAQYIIEYLANQVDAYEKLLNFKYTITDYEREQEIKGITYYYDDKNNFFNVIKPFIEKYLLKNKLSKELNEKKEVINNKSKV